MKITSVNQGMIFSMQKVEYEVLKIQDGQVYFRESSHISMPLEHRAVQNFLRFFNDLRIATVISNQIIHPEIY